MSTVERSWPMRPAEEVPVVEAEPGRFVIGPGTAPAGDTSSANGVVTLPVEVRSARVAGAQWFVDADAAQAVIDYSGLKVQTNRKGKAVVSVNIVQYVDNDLGPYNELAVAYVVEPHEPPATKPKLGEVATFIHRLPVDGEFTCAAGRGIWGYPKWVTTISYAERGRSTEGQLVDHGEFVLDLRVQRGLLPVPAKTMQMVSYAWRDGTLFKTPFTSRSSGVRLRPGGGAEISLGRVHPLAAELRGLGLPAKPFLSMTVHKMTSTFGAAEIVTPAS